MVGCLFQSRVVRMPWFAQDFPALALEFSHPGTSSVPDKPGHGHLTAEEGFVPNCAVPHIQLVGEATGPGAATGRALSAPTVLTHRSQACGRRLDTCST